MDKVTHIDEIKTKRAEEKARKAEEEAANRRAAASAQREEWEELREAAGQWLDQWQIRYVQRQNRYLFKVGHRWELMEASSMARRHANLKDPKFEQAVSVVMEERGWKFSNVCYTLKKPPIDMFNMMVTDHWGQPVDEPHHWLFDCLMQALGSGKDENISHLEHVIVYKYFYPHCYLLPAILIHGEGAVGKSLLVDNVLHTLFDAQTVSATAKNLVGNFNSLIVGRVVVLLNEANAEKIGNRREELKAMLHQPRIPVNEKGIKEYLMDNFYLLFISSNDREGGIFLDRSEADRRYSVFFAEKGKTLVYWICQKTGWSPEEARKWMLTEGDAITKNAQEIGKWIWHLAIKHNPEEQVIPQALHGGDYDRLMEIQSQSDERMCKAVFLESADEDDGAGMEGFDFTHIRREVLEKAYELRNGKAGAGRFRDRVTQWLANHAPHIKLRKVWIPVDVGYRNGRMEQRRRPEWVYYNTQKADKVFTKSSSGAGRPAYVDNDRFYIKEENHRWTWIGPEF